MKRRRRAGSRQGALPAAPPPGLTASQIQVGAQPLLLISFPVPAQPASLTPSEREVARMVATGASNREIAQARGTSERTIANQVASLLRKFSVGSRFELIAALSGPLAADP